MNKYIIGCDEVGYGSLSGPLVICGVKARDDWTMAGIKDSKLFKTTKDRKKRDDLRDKLIVCKDIQYHIAERSNTHIDTHGVAFSLRDCYEEIADHFADKESVIVIDGSLKYPNIVNKGYKLEVIEKADNKFATVMVASIIAKSYRDDLMKKLDYIYPEYNFKENYGYWGAKTIHVDAIMKYGPSPIHRMSYAPMKNMK